MSPEHIELQAVVAELCVSWLRTHGFIDLTVDDRELVSA